MRTNKSESKLGIKLPGIIVSFIGGLIIAIFFTSVSDIEYYGWINFLGKSTVIGYVIYLILGAFRILGEVSPNIPSFSRL